MKRNEWHVHFNDIMTQLCEAQEQLKEAPHNSDKFHCAHKEVRARMHDLDCLTNVAITPIEPEEGAEAQAHVAHLDGVETEVKQPELWWH